MKGLYDAHCHLNLPKLKHELHSIIQHTEKYFDFLINVGFDMKSSEESLLLSEKYKHIYASVGVHPNDAASFSNDTYDFLVRAGIREKTVAIGEIGLDYYWLTASTDIQKEVFRKQMYIAAELAKPVIIHDRDAHEDVISILEEFKDSVTGILHSFSGNMHMVEKAYTLGYYFSISGPVTFLSKNNEPFRHTVSQLPVDRILIETDCPYLTPHPFRGKTNSPLYITYILNEIAALKQMQTETLLKTVRENARSIIGV